VQFSQKHHFTRPRTISAAIARSKLGRILFFLAPLLILATCQPTPDLTEISGAIQGTTYHIKLVLPEPHEDLSALRQAIDQTFQDIDLKLSNYRDDSEITRFNRQETLDWVPVSPELTYLTHLAQQVSDKTGGCFDLTIKPLFDLWGFSKTENRIPSDAEIKQVLTHVGMNKVEVDVAGGQIRKMDPAVQIDLSSVGQGYTVSALSRLLERAGIQNYLVEVGGEMKVKGHKADGTPWRVAIEKPTPYTREVQRILDIHQESGTAIMTAGTYRHFFEDQGQVYSHILDPHTGRPVTHQLLSVTVLHDDPTWADVWDTALLCVGETEAARIAEAERLKVLLIYQENQQFMEHMSSAFMTAQ
jgi:FAD:protein FMN transferase